MGTGSSRLGSRPSRTRLGRTNSTRTRLSSFLICGGSSSRAHLEMEEYPADIAVNSSVNCDPAINIVQKPLEASSPVFTSATEFSSSNAETRTLPGSSTQANLQHIETSNLLKYLPKSKELVSPSLVSADSCHDESYRDRSNAGSTSFNEPQSSNPVSLNILANEDSIIDIGNPANEAVPQLCPEPRSSRCQGLGNSPSHGASDENHVAEMTSIQNSNSDSVAHVSGLPIHSLREETISSGLGFLVSNREQTQVDESLLHVDVVSISSNILSSADIDRSNREARRNSRRLFWDAFSRRSSRRLSDPHTIVFSTDDNDDLGSRDRWLLDFSGDFFDDGGRGDSGYLGGSVHSLHERRRYSRSEIWERLRGGGIDDNNQRNTFCPSGIHPDGTCSCESFLMTDESSNRASISRIVMLAEALFEVLDEIHRQPMSLSLSMVSLPAPESVVDSFPLKSHKKVDSTDRDDIEQCYICLAEYEEGDKIRVLPCHHEYHMSCVDKWLKEIHGVCPLCRGDVRHGVTGCSNSENPSLS